MPSSFYIPILLGGMILTGSSNSLWTKWQATHDLASQDMQCVENCSDPDPSKQVLFEQPVWQTLQMFLGEMLCQSRCFLPVLYTWLSTRHQSPSVHLPPDSELDPHVSIKLGTSSQHLTGWKVLLFWIPALCDLTGTTLMNVGLLYTPVSVYQMTRGALVLFVGVFSVIFLHRRLWLYQWISLIIVMTGVGLVGFSGSLIKDAIKEPSLAGHSSTDLPPLEPIEQPEMTTVLVGVFFVLFAQIFTATQFVVEEKIMAQYSVAPLVAVGYEGLFGVISILVFIPILALPSVSKMTPFFDLPRGWHQMVDNPPVLNSGIAIAFSIAFFNYFGLSVTRHDPLDLAHQPRTWLGEVPVPDLSLASLRLLTPRIRHVSTPPCLPGPSAAGSPIRIGDEEEDEADALLSSSILDETAALPADLGQGGFDIIPEDQIQRHHHVHDQQPQAHSPPQTGTEGGQSKSYASAVRGV
ncbi:hypothetical protein D9615_001854 [Tricholomella constricta]|uniref:Solute carrier family 35 member F6 n=1 Tax=Tricholomella constricta TaxID=117010 RepID=A0A8H5HPD8_9AGAR|nr:hypothetical protein D9615_001854 [Tricholomella constricta]